MRVQLTWSDPNTQQVRSPTLETPIAFGREFGDMPSAMKTKAIRRMVLASEQVAPFHAIMAEAKGQLAISNRQADKQTLVNGVAKSMQRVNDGDRLTIGPFEITVAILSATPVPAKADPFAGMAPAASSLASSHAASSPVAPMPSPVQQPVAEQSFPQQSAPQSPSPQSASAMAGGLAMGLSAGAGGGGLGAQPQAGGAMNFFGPDGTCTRKVGFLFKRPCGRTTTQGCPDCQNGNVDPNRDRYQEDYSYYPGYGRYGRGRWGHDYYYHRDRYHYDPHNRHVDFNESDAASFAEEGDRDYEMDLDAS